LTSILQRGVSGGDCPRWQLSLVAIVQVADIRVAVLRWKLSRWL